MKQTVPPNRILVVDDDASILRLVATVLRRELYDVDTANGGRDALSKIELTPYDVVVLDLTMPQVSGLDVLKRLAVRDRQVKCVVIMSARHRFDVAMSITPNVYAALPKPFDIKSLIAAVAGCIEAACNPAAPPHHSIPKAA